MSAMPRWRPNSASQRNAAMGHHRALLRALSSRRQPSIDGENRSARVARTIRDEERDRGADLLRRGGAPERQRVDELSPFFRITDALVRLSAENVEETVRRHRPGIDRDDPDAVARADASERLGKRRKGGV